MPILRFHGQIVQVISPTTAHAAAARATIWDRQLRLAGHQRLGRHALGQHDRDDPVIAAVVPDAVRRAQAVPQAVGNLILAQAAAFAISAAGVFARAKRRRRCGSAKCRPARV
jgi:hypothetical protein